MNQPETDVMLDIETLGNNINPAITQISAVGFRLETGEVLNEFNVLVDPMDCIKNDLEINQSTLKFWASQDKAVFRKVVLESFLSGETLDVALVELNNYLKDVNARTVWGNGIIADNVWLESAYKSRKIEPFWKYYQHRDVRTLVDLAHRLNSPDYKANTEFIGEKHNAIDDCKYQIKYCHSYFKHIGGNE